MTWLKRKWLVLILLLVVVGIVSGFAFSRSPKPQYFTGTVQRGDIRTAVQATGTIDAVTTVQVGSQVSGTISKPDSRSFAALKMKAIREGGC